MTPLELLKHHREQVERFEHLATNHKTTGAPTHRNAVARRNTKLAQFHMEAVECLKLLLASKQ